MHHVSLRSTTFAMLSVVTLLGPAACQSSTEPTVSRLPDADLRVLFVGNSLTYTNGLPGIFATVAEATGHTVSVQMAAAPNYSLEDHWNAGIAGVVGSAAADVVVLQQGPSSLPENQVHLRTWTQRFDSVIVASGGRTALYMVWPSQDRIAAFDAVRMSYAGAAEAVGGLFAPAGEAWREAWMVDPGLALYGSDGFHPTEAGSLLAALTLYRVITGRSVADLPHRLEPTSDALPTIDIPDELAPVLFGAVESAVERWGTD